MMAGYLTAWVFALTTAVGALVLLMIGHAVNATWTRETQPVTEAIVRTLPAIALLFVPLAIWAGDVFPWVEHPPEHLASWFSRPAWIVRSCVYLLSFVVFGELLVRRPPATRAIATGGLPVVAVTITFGAFDWVMSMTPHWSSTIFGLLVFAGGFVGGLGLVALCARVSTYATGALGRLLFAFLIVWAYFEFSQALIQWIANRPAERVWYVERGSQGWGGVMALLIVAHFALPFLALLPYGPKRRPRVLAAIGAWLLGMHFVDTAWLVLPAVRPSPSLSPMDAVATVSVITVSVITGVVRRRSAA